jgi:hypothetical protein
LFSFQCFVVDRILTTVALLRNNEWPLIVTPNLIKSFGFYSLELRIRCHLSDMLMRVQKNDVQEEVRDQVLHFHTIVVCQV